jgi:4-nitrophenyl phosphatase
VTWALDLDGVVWLAGRPIQGSADAIRRLRAAGERVVFLTNNSGPTPAFYVERLARAGIAVHEDDVITSAQAAASLLAPGSSASVVGGPGVVEALERRGVKVVEPSRGPDAVVVGRAVDYDDGLLSAVTAAVRGGAQFLATNTDPTFPTPAGLVPGAGALVAFVQVASGTEPLVAGKPHAPMARLLRDRAGAVDVLVGDRPDTDGLMARSVGARFVLVLSGVTRRTDLPVEPTPDEVVDDLGSSVRALGLDATTR